MKGESGCVTVPHRTRDAPRTLSFVYAHSEAGQLGGSSQVYGIG
jgi:hypothetical protein